MFDNNIFFYLYTLTKYASLKASNDLHGVDFKLVQRVPTIGNTFASSLLRAIILPFCRGLIIRIVTLEAVTFETIYLGMALNPGKVYSWLAPFEDHIHPSI